MALSKTLAGNSVDEGTWTRVREVMRDASLFEADSESGYHSGSTGANEEAEPFVQLAPSPLAVQASSLMLGFLGLGVDRQPLLNPAAMLFNNFGATRCLPTANPWAPLQPNVLQTDVSVPPPNWPVAPLMTPVNNAGPGILGSANGFQARRCRGSRNDLFNRRHHGHNNNSFVRERFSNNNNSFASENFGNDYRRENFGNDYRRVDFGRDQGRKEGRFFDEGRQGCVVDASCVASLEAGQAGWERRLRELTERTGYAVVQRNGQRIYGGPPPNWSLPAPCQGCEVFVGRVPRDCFEDELVPVFEKIGQIYELRLMMDFSGTNRGYLFVRYTCEEHAVAAIERLNGYQIRPGKRIGVTLSIDNRRLWVGGIPSGKTAEEIREEMSKLTPHVVNVVVCGGSDRFPKMRPFCFVEYENHRAAALARRALVPNKFRLFGSKVEKVDWADPSHLTD